MNSLTLYKVDWAVGSNPQPYFGDVDWRTNYFNSAPSKSVNAAGVNIKFSPEFTADFVVNVDYTTIEGYNYIVANYNNKTYYMHINTYETVSLGFSKIYCTRDFFTEYINFFQYFNNFRIYKTNIYSKIFDENSGYLHNFNYRTKFKSVTPSIIPKCDFLPSDVIKANSYPFLMIVLNSRDGNFSKLSQFTMNMTPTNYYLLFLPLENKAGGYYTYEDGKYISSGSVMSDLQIKNFLDRISPLIISYNFVYLYLPAGGEYEQFKYLYPGIHSTTYSFTENEIGYTYMLYYMEYHYNQFIETSADIYFSFDVELSNFLDKVHLLVGQPDFKVDFNVYDYYKTEESIYKFNIKFCYTFSDEGVSITLQITSPGTMNSEYSTYFLNYDILSGLSFTVDQSASVMLQNKYYSQITAVNKNLKKDLGSIAAAESIGNGIITGLTSITGGLFDQNFGGVFGGIGSIGTGIVSGVVAQGRAELEADAYAQVRDLALKNEMSKPPQVSISENALASAYILKGNFSLLIEEPYDVDQTYINNMFYCEGFDINKFEAAQLPIADYLVSKDSFYIKCDCDNNSKLPTYIVNYFRDMLKTGCRFMVFGR